jgi:hypothetical protein
MSRKRRIATLRVLVRGHPMLKNSPKILNIVSEVNRIESSGRLSNPNGWLLAVLHTTRALDTTLSEIVRKKRWPIGRYPGLGAYLSTLEDHKVIKSHENAQYTNSLLKKATCICTRPARCQTSSKRSPSSTRCTRASRRYSVRSDLCTGPVGHGQPLRTPNTMIPESRCCRLRSWIDDSACSRRRPWPPHPARKHDAPAPAASKDHVDTRISMDSPSTIRPHRLCGTENR